MSPEPSPACYALTKRFEKCRLRAYLDTAANPPVWTCGWGATGPDVVEGTVWTQEEADARLERDIMEHWRQMCALVKVALTQGQVDALTDFTYNEGSGNLRSSQLLRLLNFGQYAEVPSCLYHEDETGQPHGWIFAGGKIRQNLIDRRKAEIALWNQ